VASWGPWLDTLHIYRQLYPQLESYKLQDLIDLFDLKPELEDKAKVYCPVNRIGFHCALYDALACALLLLHLFSHPELKEINIPWLLLQSTASAEKRANFLQQELL
ncbi:MAG: 3'-5' exonuclease, partial [Verrucomicrobiota bacterium]|nr:3'-5' exonuclease [Verrucomicrobiota bacterium]